MGMLKGKVAKILDERTLVLNIGADKGAAQGMKFLVTSADESEVRDPDTHEVLGVVSVPKVRVQVVKVDSKYSVAETYEYTTVNEGGHGTVTSLALGKMFEPPKLVKKYKTFAADGEQRQEIDEAKSVIKIGDIAEEIIG